MDLQSYITILHRWACVELYSNSNNLEQFVAYFTITEHSFAYIVE